MTIIVAAKNSNGILTCYDTVEYRLLMGILKTAKESYSHKVHPLGGNVFVGITNWTWGGEPDKVIENTINRFDTTLEAGTKTKSKTLSEIVRNERKPFLEILRSEIPDRKYLFGVFEDNSFRLFVSGDKFYHKSLRGFNYYGIGSGMYPDVWAFLRNYDPRMSDDELKSLLEDAVKLAKELSRKNSLPLKGFGCSRLTSKCFEVIDFSED